MSTIKETHLDKGASCSSHQYSDSISKRRKALFKTQDNSHSSNEAKDVNIDADFKLLEDDTHTKMIDNNSYVILEKLDEKCNDTSDIIEANNSEILETSTETSPAKSIINDSSYEESPTQKLRTPNETSSAKVGVPKLIRKSLLDNCYESGKRLANVTLTSDETTETHQSKLSKIRTALFPEESFGLPTKSFYSTTETVVLKKSPRSNFNNTQKKKSGQSNLYLCNRLKRTKNRFGSINAGVGHKIKKPKRKIMKKEAILKAALNIMDNSPLNKYIEDNKTENSITSNTENFQINPIPINVENKAKKPDTFIIEINKDSNNKKRPLSPSETNNNERKFFKSSRHKIIEVDKSFKTKVINNDSSKKSAISKDKGFDFEFNTSNEFESSIPINHILNVLDDKENSDNSNIIQNNKRNINLMSPTSEMCDLTLSLAINSPKKARLNISEILENESSKQGVLNKFNSSDTNAKKYYSIFTLMNKTEKEKSEVMDKAVINCNKKWKPIAKDQMLLDAGQKRFGVTQCSECQVVYFMGDPNEELMHLNYHNAVNILKYTGWKHEKVVNCSIDYKVIKVAPGDSKLWWKKVHDVLEFVNRDLGFYEMKMNTENSQVYFYIKNKQILGCLVAEPITTAYKMLESNGEIDLCSKETYVVKCGISRIWVKKECRRAKIATTLMNCLRLTFMFGNGLNKTDIAFSSPTADGKLFAAKYCGYSDFFVYM